MRTPLFGLGIASKARAVTATKLINLYCEIRPAGEKSQIVAYGSPGTKLFTTFGDTPCRDLFEQGDFLYAVHRGVFWEVNNAGVQTNRGMLNTTSGRVSIASNGAQIMIVDGLNGYIYNVNTTAFAQITDVDFFANPTTVTWQDGYFLVSFQNSGRFQKSALYDGLAWDSLDFANAESSPDDLVAIIADHNEICLFGQTTTEFWQNIGGDGFPYTSIKGATIERGLAARWSLCKYNDGLAFVGKNVAGQVQIMWLKGYVPTVISTVDLDTIINRYATVSDATAFAFNWYGHPFLQVNFPSENESWRYDSTTGIWSEVKSFGGRHLAEIQADYLNKSRVSDYANGNVYTIADVYTDNGEEIESEIISETVRAPDGQRFTVNNLRLDMELGVGLISGQGEDPQVMLQVSRDGGYTWGAEDWRPIGRIGQYNGRVEWRNRGTSYQQTYKIRITDPVKRCFLSASINPND